MLGLGRGRRLLLEFCTSWIAESLHQYFVSSVPYHVYVSSLSDSPSEICATSSSPFQVRIREYSYCAGQLLFLLSVYLSVILVTLVTLSHI